MVTHVRAALEASLRRPFVASNMMGMTGTNGYAVFSMARAPARRGHWSDFAPVLAYRACTGQWARLIGLWDMDARDSSRAQRLVDRVSQHLAALSQHPPETPYLMLTRAHMGEFVHLFLHGEAGEKWAV